MLSVRLIFCTLLVLKLSNASGQQADTSLYKTKYESFKAREQNGKGLTITGLAEVTVGCIFLSVASANEDAGSKFYNLMGWSGLYLTGAGIFSTIIGGIDWYTGKKKAEEYKLKLDGAASGAYIIPGRAGLKLTFNF